MPIPSTSPPPVVPIVAVVRGRPGRRCVVLMNQSSGDHTLLGVRPSPGPGRGAVSPQSSQDEQRKRSLPGSTVRKEGRAISDEFRVDGGALRALVPRVLAALVRRGEDFDAAEDALQEALLDALRVWPQHPPHNPRAWLTAVAMRR